jgi:hypothetical protein
MDVSEFKELIEEIVLQAARLKDKHTHEEKAVVEYACIFSQSKAEYEKLLRTVKEIGSAIKETPTGLLFRVTPIETVSGSLRLVKIRLPDATRPERGDADFRIPDYDNFKKIVLTKKGFSLIERSDFEMIELVDKLFNVRAYFSNPPISKQYKLENAPSL